MNNTNSVTVTYAVAVLRHELLIHGEVYNGFKASLKTAEAGLIEAKGRGIFRKDGMTLAVGDFVDMDIIDETEKKGNPIAMAVFILMEICFAVNAVVIFRL